MRHAALLVTSLLTIAIMVPAVQAAIIGTAAGGGPDHLPQLLANLNGPTHIAWDGAGNLYVAVGLIERVNAFYSCKIYKIDPAGVLTQFAGSGEIDLTIPLPPVVDGIQAKEASLYNCRGLAVDAAGNVYISDSGHDGRVRRVDVATGIIATVAGGAPDSPNQGDGGLALGASMRAEQIAFDPAGNLYIADTRNNRIRRVDAATQIITTYAGGGPDSQNNGDGGPATNASLLGASGIGFDPNGNLYIADTFHHAIRRVNASTGIISLVASSLFCGANPPAPCPEIFNTLSPRIDADGNVFFLSSTFNGCPTFTSNSTVYRIDAQTGFVTPAAGVSQCGGYSGDGGPATAALLNTPAAIGLSREGDLLIPDSRNHRLRGVDRGTGIITTRAGNGLPFLSGNGFPAASAGMRPRGAAVDDAGNLFIADRDSNVVRRVDASTGIIETFAGGGSTPVSDPGPMPKTSVRLVSPESVAVDHAGNAYIAHPGIIVNGLSAGRIWRVDAGSDQIYQFSGGVSGGVSTYYGLATNLAGDLYVSADFPDQVFVFRASCFPQCTVAGNGVQGFSGDGGPALAAALNNPHGIAVDSLSNLYIADTGNQRVRRVDAVTGIITTVAGNGTRGFGGDGGLGTAATLADPFAVAVDADGGVLISDAGNFRIRRLDPATGRIDTVAGNGGHSPVGDGGDPRLAGIQDAGGIAAAMDGSYYFADLWYERLRVVTTNPIAHAGHYPTLECMSAGTASVQLDGSGSVAGGSHLISFEWFEDYGQPGQQLLGTGESLAVLFPLGSHLVTLRITDQAGRTDTDIVTILVADTVAPALTCPPPRLFGCASGAGTTIDNFVATVSEACGTATVTNDHNTGGLDASGFYPVGTTLVTFESVDGAGNRSTCSQTVTVQANTATPPVVQVEVSPTILKPHNRRMVRVRAQVSAESVCGNTTFVLTSITSNEPDDAPGGSDGNTVGDIQEATIGSPDVDFLLRAERDSQGDGRIYTIVYTATDPAGQTATGSAEVLVLKKGSTKVADVLTLDPPPKKGGKGAPTR